MMKADKNIPVLRFPEFEGEWHKSKLGKLFELVSGQHLNPDEYTNDFSNNLIPYFTGPSDFTNDPEKLLKWSLGSGKIAIFNDILFTVKGNGVGTLMLLKLPQIAIGRQLMAIRETSGLIAFLVYVLIKRKQYFEALASGNLIPGLTRSDILDTEEFFPSLPEQRKIASFLSSVDQRIHLLTQKKEKLEQYKKGLMQRMFSQQLRFKPALSEVEGDENGQDYPEWEVVQFGSLYQFLSTNSLSREKLNYESGLVKNIHYGDIHTKYKSHFLIDIEIVPYINPDVDLRKTNSINYLQEGDLVIADASEDYADIGKSIEICSLNGQPVLAGLHTLQARRKDNKITIGYGGHMMKSPEIRIQIQRIAQGTKVLSIAAIRLSEVKIQLPCRSEQQKIATLLSSIDDKINHISSQIELTRKWKQGLLQKMFV